MDVELKVGEGTLRYFCSNSHCNFASTLAFSGGEPRSIPELYEYINSFRKSNNSCPKCNKGTVRIDDAEFKRSLRRSKFPSWIIQYRCGTCAALWTSQVVMSEGDVYQRMYENITCPSCNGRKKIDAISVCKKAK